MFLAAKAAAEFWGTHGAAGSPRPFKAGVSALLDSGGGSFQAVYVSA